MASAKSAVGSIMDTVATASGAVCSTINMVSKSATYGTNWMDSVLKQQSIRLKADNAIFEATYAETRAAELAQHRQQIATWVAGNPDTKELYEQSLALINAAIKAE